MGSDCNSAAPAGLAPITLDSLSDHLLQLILAQAEPLLELPEEAIQAQGTEWYQAIHDRLRKHRKHYPTLLALAGVCKRWRGLVLSTPLSRRLQVTALAGQFWNYGLFDGRGYSLARALMSSQDRLALLQTFEFDAGSMMWPSNIMDLMGLLGEMRHKPALRCLIWRPSTPYLQYKEGPILSEPEVLPLLARAFPHITTLITNTDLERESCQVAANHWRSLQHILLDDAPNTGDALPPLLAANPGLISLRVHCNFELPWADLARWCPQLQWLDLERCSLCKDVNLPGGLQRLTWSDLWRGEGLLAMVQAMQAAAPCLHWLEMLVESGKGVEQWVPVEQWALVLSGLLSLQGVRELRVSGWLVQVAAPHWRAACTASMPSAHASWQRLVVEGVAWDKEQWQALQEWVSVAPRLTSLEVVPAIKDDPPDWVPRVMRDLEQKVPGLVIKLESSRRRL